MAVRRYEPQSLQTGSTRQGVFIPLPIYDHLSPLLLNETPKRPERRFLPVSYQSWWRERLRFVVAQS